MKGLHEQAFLLGWHVRNLAHVKQLKPVAHYLRPALTPEEKREQGARDVKAMFKRLAAKGAKNGV